MKESTLYDKKSLKTIVGKSSDFNELARDCVGFANAKGGHLHIGIEDNEDVPPCNQQITTEIEDIVKKRINELTLNVAISTKIITADNGGQYIDLGIMPSMSTLACTTKGGYYLRVGDSTRSLLPEDMLRLLDEKSAYCWETRVVQPILWGNCDAAKLSKFVEDIRKSDRVSAFVKEKSVEELLEYYLFVDETGRLTNLGILWLGKQEQRARLLYSPCIQFIKYDANGDKVNKLVWDDYSRNPQELLEAVWNDIPDWKEYNEISVGLWRKQIPAYNEKVVREAICNAIVHRPYTTRGDIFINMHPDYMTIVNPGLLPLGVTTDNILHKTIQRNEHLAKVFYDLHLMEKEGSGYDLMYESLLSEGKKIPIVSEGDDFVALTIQRHIVDPEAYRLMEHVTNNYKVSQSARIALGIIIQAQKISAFNLAKEMQLTAEGRLRTILTTLIQEKVILYKGQKKGTTYYINPTVVANTKANIITSLKTIEPYRLQALIEEDLRYHPYSSMAEIAKRLPDVDFKELQKMVRKMVTINRLNATEGRKYRKYYLPQ